jgi:hypothetical protein
MDDQVRDAHFRLSDLRYGHVLSCVHCGSLCSEETWKLHVTACPALAKWVREQVMYYDRQTYDLDRIMRSQVIPPPEPATLRAMRDLTIDAMVLCTPVIKSEEGE